MKKSNISFVLAALLATSGFAMAQTTPATGDAKTRAEVKAGINAPNTQPGSPTQDARSRSETPVPANTGTSAGITRAEVKAGINAPNAAAGSPTQDARARSEASVPSKGGTTENTRAEVKAEAGTGMKVTKATTAAERRAARAERKAARSKATPAIATSKEAGGASSKVNAN